MVRNVQLIVLIQALAAAELRSFRKASEQLGVRTSTISRRIRELEERLGVPIFQRHRHGVRPTDAGAAFLDEARRIISDLQSLITNTRAGGRSDAGRLRVGFYLSLSAGELRTTLLAFKEIFPEVDLRVTEASRRRLIEHLNAGRLDVIIVASQRSSVRFETLPLWNERILVALPAEHALAARSALDWNDLRDELFLLPEHDPGPELQSHLLSRFEARSGTPQLLQLGITCDNALNLVSFGCSVTLLYEAESGTAHDGVVYRDVRGRKAPASTPYLACWDNANTNPALKSFLDLLRQRYPQPADASSNGRASQQEHPDPVSRQVARIDAEPPLSGRQRREPGRPTRAASPRQSP